MRYFNCSRWTIVLILPFLAACWTPEGPYNVKPPGDPRCDGDCPPNFQIDTDGDCITDLLETNPTNVNLYQFDVEECDEDPSTAVGFPDGGTLTGGLNLRDTGDGYIHHLGTDAADTDDWGTLDLCRCIQLAGREWGVFHNVRMQVGDMSLQNGGHFSPHVSHQNGRDADMRYMRNDREDPLDIASSFQRDTYYDKLATFTIMVNLINQCRVQTLFTDPTVVGFTNDELFSASDVETNGNWLQYASGHTDHFHLRIHQPN